MRTLRARAKRVVKESSQAAKGKRKRGRKSKSSPPEPEEDTADLFCVLGSVASYRRARHRRAMLSPSELVSTSLLSHRCLAC